jgi:Ser/Thr protein kinase RdoA (MazF antagonist)
MVINYIDCNKESDLYSFCESKWRTSLIKPHIFDGTSVNDILEGNLNGSHIIHKIFSNDAGGISESRLGILEKIANCLENINIKIPTPIPTVKGHFMEIFDGKPIVTFTYLEGAPCKRNSSDTILAFETLGKIHSQLQGYQINEKDLFVPSFIDLFYKFKEKFNAAKPQSDLVGKVLFLAEKFIENYDVVLNKSSKGLIHGDFGLKHVFKGGSNVGVIDWDYFNSGLLIHDVSRLYDDAIRRNSVPKMDVDLALKSYQSFISFNDADLELAHHSFKYRMLYRSLNLSLKLIDNPNSKGLTNFLDKTFYYLMEEGYETHDFKL